MASETHLGITKGQLAWLSDLPNQNTEFTGLPTYKKELEKHYKVFKIGIDEEGSHLKCNLVFLGFFAIVAGGCATWLFLTQGQGGVISAVCLTVLSAGFISTAVIMVVLTARKQKSLENQYEEQVSVTVCPKVISQALQQPDVSSATIQTIANRLEGDQRKAFIHNAYSLFDTNQELSLDEAKIFKALINDPYLLELIPQKGRAFALAILSCAEPESPESLSELLFGTLVLTIGAPESPEEAALFAKCPAALQRYIAQMKDYIDTSKLEAEQFSFKRDFLKHTVADTPLALIQKWLEPSRSTEEAEMFARHPLAISAYLEQPVVNKAVALKMLRYLPKDSHPELLHTLFVSAEHPSSKEGAEFFNNHPTALAKVFSEDGNFAIKYLQAAKKNIVSLTDVASLQNKDPASYAKDPKAVACLALSAPLWFGPSVIFSMFSLMNIKHKIEFLKEMDITNPHSCAVVDYILEHLLTKEFVQQYDGVPESTISENFGILLGQLGRWPKLVANRLFGEVETENKKTDFGTENSLLRHELFVRWFFQSMSEGDRKACIDHAVVRVYQHGEKAVTVCIQWLMLKKFPKWLIPVLAESPEVLAKALCSNEHERSNRNGIEIVSTMNPIQLEIYEQMLMQYFLAHYEKMVFDDRKDASGLTERLITRLRYLHTHLEWVNTNNERAKRYIELSANVISKGFDFQTDLMKTQTDLFDIYTVKLNQCAEDFPAYRLAALSPPLAARKTSDITASNAKKTITLDGTFSDDEAAGHFMFYLKTGELPDGADVLALSYLAHVYEMGHLSALCTQAIEETLDKDTYKVYSEAAVKGNLWEILTLCLAFISSHSRDPDIIRYSKNPAFNLVRAVNTVPTVNDRIGDLLRFGIRCPELGIKISYQPGDEVVRLTPGFGRYLYVTMGKRKAHISNNLHNIEVLHLQELISPTAWSTANCDIALNLTINLGNEKLGLWPIFLQCVEETVPLNIELMLPLDQALPLYQMASQLNKQNMTAKCLQRIEQSVQTNFVLLKTVLIFAVQRKLLDLKCACLKFISPFRNMAVECVRSVNEDNSEFKDLLQLGIDCADEAIGITYACDKLQILVNSFTEDKGSLKGNQDKVMKTLVALHKIKRITELVAENSDIFRGLNVQMRYLGVPIVLKPRPLPQVVNIVD